MAVAWQQGLPSNRAWKSELHVEKELHAVFSKFVYRILNVQQVEEFT